MTMFARSVSRARPLSRRLWKAPMTAHNRTTATILSSSYLPPQHHDRGPLYILSQTIPKSTSRMTPNTGTGEPEMAAVATQPIAPLPNPIKFRPIIEHAEVVKQAHSETKFDPVKHLEYTAPPGVVLMKDIGFSEDVGISPVAVSQPFQLFSPEAIEQMRAEIFQPEVMEKCSFTTNLAACQLRGYAPKYAPFAYDAWNHPDTLKIISDIAGIELIPEMDYEIGHINLSVKTEEETKADLAVINKQKRMFAEDEGIAGCPWEDDKPIVGWHMDSYPFVCVLMLSDCTGMVGGETALRTANGEILKVRGPQCGSAVVMQGRYIEHQALRALGMKERITSVTSFRPRSPFVKDESRLRTVRGASVLSELYYEFAEYRLEILEERLRKERKDMMIRRRAGKKFDTMAHKNFLQETLAFIKHNDNEIVEDSKVVPGHLPEGADGDAPDVEVGAQDASRPEKRLRVN